MNSCIMAIDQGTTGTQVGFYNAQTLQLISQAKCEFRQHYPAQGWVEHNPAEIWESLQQSFTMAASFAAQQNSHFNLSDVRAIGITNQRETSLAWNRKTGAPAGNAIVWQDRRTQPLCEQLKSENREKFVNTRTGLLLDPYFSATKWRWMLQNNAQVQMLAQEDNLCLGTVDAWLIWHITQGKSFVTDHTNASRTLLYNIHKGEWDDELLELFRIKKSWLPSIVNSIGVCGTSKGFLQLPDDVPIGGCIGDQQSALFGQNCERLGSAKITFGTGSFLLVHTGETPVTQEDGLLATVALSEEGKSRTFAREGAAFIAGAAVQFVRDNLKWIETAAEIEEMASVTERDNHLLFIPSFAGLPAPWWNASAKAVLFGLTRGTSKQQIARAILESVALQNASLIAVMTRGAPEASRLAQVLVDGGASHNNFLMQFQADILQCSLTRPAHVEATALGAAKCAARAIGLSTTGNEKTREAKHAGRTFSPTISLQQAQVLVEQWTRAASFVNDFYSSMI